MMRGTLRALVTLSRTTRNTAIRRYTAASTSTHPRDSRLDLTTTVLLDALPAVSQYGFSKHAYIHAAGAQTDLDRRSRTVDTLFPGPNSTFEAALFQTWNSVSNHAAIRATSPQDIIAILRANGTLDGESQRPVRINAQVSEEEQRKALEKVAELMLDRLRLSWNARPHLQQGLAAVSTASPETSTWHSVFPHKTVLPDLPTPRPLLEMAGGFVGEALAHPAAQQRTGWIDSDGVDCGVVRAHSGRTRHGRHRHRAHSALVIHPVGAVGQSWLARCV
ncbi:hypothetical protein PANT_4c00024 [Moesziomyces antarcticus T-34]|uniref:Uncharacterized protein n=1 Tax=Pseudozyma antarctica (strain T-34) TaxID=1151754 RepID=M9MCD0_PSEA3|nr:hypothetical protein PANT_4c00024 [Moesziomyces antarcticus T-34]